MEKGICSLKNYKPIIMRNSRGEQVAGFLNTQTNEFTECQKIESSKDIDEFLEAHELSVIQIIKR